MEGKLPSLQRVAQMLREHLECSRFTVPVLWDKKQHTIVNNESSEIIRIFNSSFNDLLPSANAAVDIYPEELRKEIDEVNSWVYDTVNSEKPHRFRSTSSGHG